MLFVAAGALIVVGEALAVVGLTGAITTAVIMAAVFGLGVAGVLQVRRHQAILSRLAAVCAASAKGDLEVRVLEAFEPGEVGEL
jgi:hypothetical protein